MSLEQARTRVLGSTDGCGSRMVPVTRAHGAVLAEDLVAHFAVPGFDCSAMDGYAVRSADLRSPPVTLEVVAVSSAGHPASRSIESGQAARILTGAVLVDGSDCVVRVEDTDAGVERVQIRSLVAPGANVRRAGEASRPGDILIGRGTVLNAAHLGVAAGAGRTELPVIDAPRVAIVSTGDELVSDGATVLAPGQIFESNGVVLAQLTADLGCAVTTHQIGDDAGRLRTLIVELSRTHDVIITSGGVSMGGEYDTLREALHHHDVEFWTMAIKPAKPMAFGRVGTATLFGLPGNPVSAIVAFEAIVRPSLRKMRGVEPHIPPTFPGVAGQVFRRKDDGKTHFIGVRRDGSGAWAGVTPFGSHILGSIAASEALVMLAPTDLVVEAGSPITLLGLWA